jgi:hypothetical protein
VTESTYAAPPPATCVRTEQSMLSLRLGRLAAEKQLPPRVWRMVIKLWPYPHSPQHGIAGGKLVHKPGARAVEGECSAAEGDC